MRVMGEEEKKADNGSMSKWALWKRRLVVIAIIVACIWGIFALLPFALSFVSFPEIFVDLSEKMKDSPPGLFRDQTLSAKYGISRKSGGGLHVIAKGRVLGWPFTVTADIDLKFKFFGLDASGTADFRLDGSVLGGGATFSASVPGGWTADVEMPKRAITDNDPFIKSVLSRHPEETVRKLVFDGMLSFNAHAEQSGIFTSVPKWEAKARIEELDASVNANNKPVRIENFRMGVKASGIDDHVDIGAMFPRIECIEGAGYVLSNAFASVRATETAFLVTEAGAKFCGGDLHLYSFFLDPKKMNAWLTVYIDGIDAGETLSHIHGFNGQASGRLNGKLPLRLKNGEEIKLGNGYLHSVPGETGNLKLYDPTPITENLMMSGVSRDTTDNLADALANLDYSALKIALTPEDGDSMALTLKLEGEATKGNVTVPVSFTVTFHGQIEQLINTGLRVATRKEQKKQ